MATEEELRREAIDRVKDRRAFVTHFGIYVIVNMALLALWAMAGGGYYWPMWTTFGWGIGVAFHGLALLVGNERIPESRIDRELNRMHGHVSGPSPTA